MDTRYPFSRTEKNRQLTTTTKARKKKKNTPLIIISYYTEPIEMRSCVIAGQAHTADNRQQLRMPRSSHRHFPTVLSIFSRILFFTRESSPRHDGQIALSPTCCLHARKRCCCLSRPLTTRTLTNPTQQKKIK